MATLKELEQSLSLVESKVFKPKKPRHYYGFQYFSGKNTTMDDKHSQSGVRIAGYIEEFDSIEERDAWVSKGKFTTDMSGKNSRISVTYKEAQSLHRAYFSDKYK